MHQRLHYQKHTIRDLQTTLGKNKVNNYETQLYFNKGDSMNNITSYDDRHRKNEVSNKINKT